MLNKSSRILLRWHMVRTGYWLYVSRPHTYPCVRSTDMCTIAGLFRWLSGFPSHGRQRVAEAPTLRSATPR